MSMYQRLPTCSPTMKSERIRHLDRFIARAVEEVGHTLPSSREVTMPVEFQAKKLLAVTRRVCRSHCPTQQPLLHTTTGQKDCDTAFDAVQSILEGECSPSPPPSQPTVTGPGKRKRFSDEQNATVKKYSALSIANKTLPCKADTEQDMKVHSEIFPRPLIFTPKCMICFRHVLKCAKLPMPYALKRLKASLQSSTCSFSYRILARCQCNLLL